MAAEKAGKPMQGKDRMMKGGDESPQDKAMKVAKSAKTAGKAGTPKGG